MARRHTPTYNMTMRAVEVGIDPCALVVGKPLFFRAIQYDLVEWVQRALRAKPHLATLADAQGFHEEQALDYWGRETVSVPMLEVLLEAGASLCGRRGTLSLRRAIRALDLEAVMVILDHYPATITYRSVRTVVSAYRFNTMGAVELGIIQNIIDALLQHGFDINGDRPLLPSVFRSAPVSFIKHQLERGATITRSSHYLSVWLTLFSLKTRDAIEGRVRLLMKYAIFKRRPDHVLVGRVISDLANMMNKDPANQLVNKDEMRQFAPVILDVFARYGFEWKPRTHFRIAPARQTEIRTAMVLRATTDSAFSVLPIELMFVVFQLLCSQ